jgi:soluble lytic murein transglycosylase-like protein
MNTIARARPRWAWLIAAVLALALAGSAQAGPGIYTYIDEDGVVHFSDVPHDARYERMKRKPRALALTPDERPEAPEYDGFDGLIARYSRAYDVEPALVKAVVAAESNFEIEAISRVGAQGLMQLMPATARAMGVEEPFEPQENLKGGIRYLRAMLDRYGDVRRALAAYNAGPEAVDQYGGIPPYPETQAYVKRVLNYYRDYRNQFGKF